MNILLRGYRESDLSQMAEIWNEVVEEGIAFPQTDVLDASDAKAFCASQSHCGVAVDADSGALAGLYILHPNNVGRCGHICNASYAVNSGLRGRHIGEKLVTDCMKQAKALGFRILQFNAVVKTNAAARRLYERLGFTQLGTIPGGFLMKNGTYEDICPYYHEL